MAKRAKPRAAQSGTLGANEEGPSASASAGAGAGAMPGSADDAAGDAIDGPPSYDAAAVGRVAACVQIQSVELVYTQFDSGDQNSVRQAAIEDTDVQFGFDAEWQISDDGQFLGCILTIGTVPASETEWQLLARFRLVYELKGATPSESDLEQFVHWNAVFNAWPYWREFLSSMLQRAGLPPLLAPVLPVPR